MTRAKRKEENNLRRRPPKPSVYAEEVFGGGGPQLHILLEGRTLRHRKEGQIRLTTGLNTPRKFERKLIK